MKQSTNLKVKAVDLSKDLQVSSVRIRRNPKGARAVAVASVTYFGQFVVKDMKLQYRDGEPYIIFPALYPATKDLPKTPIVTMNREARLITRSAIATAYSIVFNRQKLNTHCTFEHDNEVFFNYNEEKDFIPDPITMDFINCNRRRMADVTITFSGVTVHEIHMDQARPKLGEKTGHVWINYPEFTGQPKRDPAAPKKYPACFAHPVSNGARILLRDEILRVYGDMTGNLLYGLEADHLQPDLIHGA